MAVAVAVARHVSAAACLCRGVQLRDSATRRPCDPTALRLYHPTARPRLHDGAPVLCCAALPLHSSRAGLRHRLRGGGEIWTEIWTEIGICYEVCPRTADGGSAALSETKMGGRDMIRGVWFGVAHPSPRDRREIWAGGGRASRSPRETRARCRPSASSTPRRVDDAHRTRTIAREPSGVSWVRSRARVRHPFFAADFLPGVWGLLSGSRRGRRLDRG
ncbi:hypothetical protein B2J93_1573 [Marssonina coronariae]|uniref:Uncharacterized protein n=1 Tax=Diplocarpon coronariae TaxID=2795749 RepID=A0A218Z1Z5_9HELO|nr:hypothetical protein B2J93_1573 [Marssonina coronariae]